MVTLNSLDARILDLMQQDATISINEIAERVNSSKTVCWRKIQKFQEQGIIDRKVTLLNPKKIGLNVKVFAHIKMTAHGRTILPEFIEAISRYPQVIECHTLMGNVDFLLKVMVRNIEEYEFLFWHEFSQIEGVQEISSSIALTEVKNTTQLPLFTEDFEAG